MFKSLWLSSQIHRSIVQISDISPVGCGNTGDHSTCLVRICLIGQFVLTAFLDGHSSLYDLNTVIQRSHIFRGDMQCIFCNFCHRFTAACQQKLPVLITFCQILNLREISVDDIVSGFIRVSEFHFLLRFINVGVVLISLVYSYIIHYKLCIFTKLRILVRISYPASAYSQI